MPALGESVTEATVGHWFKKPGEAVKVDEPLVRAGDRQGDGGGAGTGGRRARRHQGASKATTVGVGSVLGSIKRRRSGGCEPQLAAPKAEAAPPRSRQHLRQPLPSRRHRGQRHAAVAVSAQDDGGEGCWRPPTCRARAARSGPEGGRGSSGRQAAALRRSQPPKPRADADGAAPVPHPRCGRRPCRTTPRARSACA